MAFWRYGENIFMIFIIYDEISKLKWDVFSWNFFQSVQTKALNVLDLLL